MAEPASFVAIVDDHEPVRNGLKRLLRAAGLEAVTFESGQAFLDSLVGRRPGCVILDLHMPGMSGLHVLRRLQSCGVQLPTLLITAYDEPEMRTLCLAVGATAYLPKPLDHRELLDAIASATDTARGRQLAS